MKCIFERVRLCGMCNELIIIDRNVRKHEYFKKHCTNCYCNIETGHLCYMAPLLPEMSSSDKVLYVFFDFETTQNTKVTAPPYMCYI
jgi:hypothetical protein